MENSQLAAALQTVQQENSELKSQASTQAVLQDAELGPLRLEVDQLRLKVKDLVDANAKLAVTGSEAAEREAQLRGELGVLQVKITELSVPQESETSLIAENETLKEQDKKHRETIRQNQTAVGELQAELANAQQQLQARTQETSALQDQITALQAQVRGRLTSKFHGKLSEAATASSQNSELGERVAGLQAEVESLKSAREEEERSFIDVTDKLHRANQLLKEEQSEKEKEQKLRGNLEKDLEAKTQQLSELQLLESRLKEALDRAKESSTTLLSQLESKAQETQHLSQQIRTMKESVDSDETSKELLLQERDAAREDVKELRTRLQHQAKLVEDLQAKERATSERAFTEATELRQSALQRQAEGEQAKQELDSFKSRFTRLQVLRFHLPLGRESGTPHAARHGNSRVGLPLAVQPLGNSPADRQRAAWSGAGWPSATGRD